MRKEKLLKHWREVHHSFEHLVKVAPTENAFQREWKRLKKKIKGSSQLTNYLVRIFKIIIL
jgi:hypothetical protein